MTRHLVLVGGGHAHLFVLEGLAAGRFPPHLRVTLVSPTGRHLYSGMLPGLLGGRYRPEEITLDLAGLVRRGGGELRETAVVALEPDRRMVRLADGDALTYDLVSFAIGSGVSGQDRPGVAGRVLLLKPIDQALELGGAVDRLAVAGGKPSLVVAGAGAAGVEVALNLRARLRKMGRAAAITVVDAGEVLLPERPAAGRVLERALARHRVAVRLGRAVAEVAPERVVLEGGDTLRADLVVWAAGAAAPALFGAAGLATDPAGFLLVDDTLRSVADPVTFAAGDAAALRGHPGTPRSGVMAVRAGPVLRDNLAAALRGGRLRPFRPPRRSLALLNTGDGEAVLSYGPVALAGRWVMALKDRIDRRFMRRFGG